MGTDGDLVGISKYRLDRLKDRSLLSFFSCDREFFLQEVIVTGQADKAVKCLQEPERIVRPPAGFFSLPVEVMVCKSILMDVGDPLTEKFLDELHLTHSGEVVHRCEDVLDLTETDLTVALLCPVERTGYEGLVEDLERKIVVYICFEILIRMLDLHVRRIILRKRDHLIEAGRKCGRIGKAGNERFELFLHGDIFFIVFVDAVRRQAGEVIDLHLIPGLYGKRSGQSEESRSLSGMGVTKDRRELRFFQCAGADEISIAGAELIREYDLIAVMDHQGVIADIALRPLRIRVKGDRTDLVIVAVEYFRLCNDSGEDNILTKRVYFLGTEHAGIDDTEIPFGSTAVFDLDELCLGCDRELVLLREDEDRTAYFQAVLKCVLDDRSVLGMTAQCFFHGILLGGTRIEDHLSVLHEVELAVRRKSVLLRQVVPACCEDLRIRMGTEASAADTVDRTFRCALQRMVKSDAVTDKHV